MTFRFFVPGSRGSKDALKPPYRPPGGSRADWLGPGHVVPAKRQFGLLSAGGARLPGALVNVRSKRGVENKGDGASLLFSFESLRSGLRIASGNRLSSIEIRANDRYRLSSVSRSANALLTARRRRHSADRHRSERVTGGSSSTRRRDSSNR